MNAEVHPDRILAELDQLWTSLAQQSGGTGSDAVLRACAMTLIVATHQEEDASAVHQTLAELIREHPSRLILVCLRPATQPLLEATVSAECWLPFGGRQQVCCEQIHITASETNLPELPALLLALAAPDLPVVLWCRQAPLLEMPAFRETCLAVDKLILDSATHPDPCAILQQLAEGCGGLPALADLSWTRLTRWREMLAQVFENPACLARLPAFSELRISYTGAAIPVSAYYLAAWITQALKREPVLHFEATCALESASSGVQGFKLAANGFHVSLWRADDSALEIEAGSLQAHAPLPPQPESSLLGQELAIAGRDPVYDSVLRLAAQIAGRQGG